MLVQSLRKGPSVYQPRENKDFSEPRRRRPRRRDKIKDLMSRTIAQHVRFKTVYIS